MRIALAAGSRRRVGGIESYLAAIIPELRRRGHEVALIHEVEGPPDREAFVSDASIPTWSLAEGPASAMAQLEGWHPDVVFVHGIEDPLLEARVASVAPAVLFAHQYRGTCVSGTKTFSSPGYQACERVLGPACLAHYLPRGCGGRSPATMMQLYRRETTRRDGLWQYRSVIALSDHIVAEYVRHGVSRAQITRVPCHLDAPAGVRPRNLNAGTVRLLFVGRMEAQKGCDLLIEALPSLPARLGRPVHLTLIGDGRTRRGLEKRSQSVIGSMVSVEFAGWLAPSERDRHFADADLLVVPSAWPEPFGLVGLEAAGHGLPAAAFGVGGISEWLDDGLSGAVAPADPPTAEKLADAIVRCVSDAAQYSRLSAGALRVAARHSMDAHVNAITTVLAAAAGLAEPATETHGQHGRARIHVVPTSGAVCG